MQHQARFYARCIDKLVADLVGDISVFDALRCTQCIEYAYTGQEGIVLRERTSQISVKAMRNKLSWRDCPRRGSSLEHSHR